MELDDFEFRPLTQGLGFDKTTEETQNRPEKKKSETLKASQFEMPQKDFAAVNKAPVSRSLKKMLDSLPPSVDFQEDSQRELKLKAPLQPQVGDQLPVYRPAQNPANPAVQTGFDVTLNNSLAKAFPKEETSKRFFHQTVAPIPQFKEIEANFASAFIDALFCGLLSSLFVVILVGITQVDIFAMLGSQQLGNRALLEIGLLFSGVTLVYFMLSRGMFGSTLGDWAFDVQLGTETERNHLMYPFQVLFRTLVIMLTGVVLVPLVSMGFGKDMAYYFSGLRLYNRQY